MPERRPPSHACEDEAREALQKARQAVDAAGVPRAAACLSMRWQRSGGAGFLITAAPEQGFLSGGREPTIHWLPMEERRGASPVAEPPPADEWRLHRDLYRRRADVEAIIRCRPTYATAIACSRAASPEGIPVFHPDVATVAGGALVRADCGLPGSTLRSEPLLAALANGTACLLDGWGLLACGASLAAATSRAAEIEALARIWWHVLQLEK